MRKSTSIALTVLAFVLATTAPTWAQGFVHAEGEFTVEIDFATLSLTPIDENCLIVVSGVVRFTGTLQGRAATRTRALASATCADVAALPPGAYEDVFTSAFEFAGRFDGRPVVADLTYRGRTALGGAIDAVLVPSNGLRGHLVVEGIVAVSGSYRGLLKATDR